MRNLVGFCFLIGFCFVARPVEDAATQSSVAETQKLMTSKSEREAHIATDTEAKKADEMAKKAMGGDDAKTDELYGIAASLLPWIMKESEGDPAKANALLLEATKDPKTFLQRLPASERAKIDDLAEKMEKDKKKKATP